MSCSSCNGRGFVYSSKVEDIIAIREIAHYLGFTDKKPAFEGRHGSQLDAPLYEVCSECNGHG